MIINIYIFYPHYIYSMFIIKCYLGILVYFAGNLHNAMGEAEKSLSIKNGYRKVRSKNDLRLQNN